MPRWLVPCALGAVFLAASVGAVAIPTGELSARSSGAPSAVAVLSPRRVPVLLSDAIAEGRLNDALDKALANAELGGAREQSCLVVHHDERVLYERRPAQSLIPASTMKILTAVAAARRLDAASKLTTRAAAAARPDRGVVAGDLWLIGGGDPLLETADYAATFEEQPQLFTDLSKLADDVAAAGVRSVEGAVRGDESRYDAQRYVPTWKPVYATDGDVGPQSALALNDGFAAYKPRKVAAPTPPGHAAAVFTELLRARGVTIAGDPASGKAPSGAHTIASLPSPDVKALIGEMLSSSDNNTAELLTKELGYRHGDGGTTRAGVTVIRDALKAARLDLAGFVAIDGSGLDVSNRVTCSLLMAALQTKVGADVVTAGLPVAAQTGTLFDRFRGTASAGRLRAKTGTLEGVVGLAGIVAPREKGPSPLAFAFLANGIPRPSDAPGRRAQERIASALAAYPDSPPPADLMP